MYQATMQGSIMYAVPTEGAAAMLFMENYVDAHGPQGDGILTMESGDGHSLTVLLPPHSEGCIERFDLLYHFECADQDAYNEQFDAVKNALYYGTAAPFCTAACDSTFQ